MDILKIPTPIGTITAMPVKNGIRIMLENVSPAAEYPLAVVHYDEDDGKLKTEIHPSPETKYPLVHTVLHDISPIKDMDLGPESPVVYISAPYAAKTVEEREHHVELARKYGRFALSQGCVPYIPHLAVCGFMNDDVPYERALGIAADSVLLGNCDELWLFGNTISPGMKEEIKLCQQLGRPIKRFTESCEPMEGDLH